MTHKVLREWDERISMSSLLGYVPTTYDRLVERLGEPTFTGDDKTTVEWLIAFEDGKVATVYDWKTYDTPMRAYDWHIGGHDDAVVGRVQSILA